MSDNIGERYRVAWFKDRSDNFEYDTVWELRLKDTEENDFFRATYIPEVANSFTLHAGADLSTEQYNTMYSVVFCFFTAILK